MVFPLWYFLSVDPRILFLMLYVPIVILFMRSMHSSWFLSWLVVNSRARIRATLVADWNYHHLHLRSSNYDFGLLGQFYGWSVRILVLFVLLVMLTLVCWRRLWPNSTMKSSSRRCLSIPTFQSYRDSKSAPSSTCAASMPVRTMDPISCNWDFRQVHECEFRVISRIHCGVILLRSHL